MRLAISNTLTAFDERDVIGSKVLRPVTFKAALAKAVSGHDMCQDRAPGQHFVHLPKSAWCLVSAGVGRKSKNAEDYLVRMHRGQPTLFLKRAKADVVEGLACVVYTREAYLGDPDKKKDLEEIDRIQGSNCTHVIVAVLAFAGPEAPLTPHRLVHNLAGGNNEVADWTMDDVQTKAEGSIAYWNVYEVVAD